MFGKIKCFSDFNSICDEGTDPIQNTCGLFARLWVHRNNGLPNDKWDENIVCQVRKSNKINLGDTSDQNIRNDKIVLLVGTEIKGFTIHKKKYHWSWLPEIVMKNPRQQMILEYRPSSSMRFYKSRIIIQPARIEKSENEIGILGIELDLANSDPVNRMPKWNKNQSRRAKEESKQSKTSLRFKYLKLHVNPSTEFCKCFTRCKPVFWILQWRRHATPVLAVSNFNFSVNTFSNDLDFMMCKPSSAD
eukprot:jgi/Bigna1/145099/aug1.95_g19807